MKERQDYWLLTVPGGDLSCTEKPDLDSLPVGSRSPKPIWTEGQEQLDPTHLNTKSINDNIMQLLLGIKNLTSPKRRIFFFSQATTCSLLLFRVFFFIREVAPHLLPSILPPFDET